MVGIDNIDAFLRASISTKHPTRWLAAKWQKNLWIAPVGCHKIPPNSSSYPGLNRICRRWHHHRRIWGMVNPMEQQLSSRRNCCANQVPILDDMLSRLHTTNEMMIMACTSSSAPDVVRLEYSRTSKVALTHDGDRLSASSMVENTLSGSRMFHEYAALARILKSRAKSPGFMWDWLRSS